MENLKLPIPESYWVVPGKFLAGEYPAGHYTSEFEARQRLDSFLEAGFNTFINLTTPEELPPYDSMLREEAKFYEMKIQHHRFAIGDFGLPTQKGMIATLNAIDSALGAGRKVYVHCWAGVGRTGTTVGCYLVRHGLSGGDALRQLAEWWQTVPKHERHKRSPENNAQMAFVLGWQE